MKRLRGFIYRRSLFLGLALLVQILFLFFAARSFFEASYLASAASLLLSVVAVLWILNDSSNSAYKLAWIIPILIFPVFGGLFYFFFGRTRLGGRLGRALKAGRSPPEPRPQDGNREVRNADPLLEDPGEARQAAYLSLKASSPLLPAERLVYHSSGEAAFEAILEALESAERSIYMEFFIIEEGMMWSAILEILERKAKEGLDVRVMYDDFGCASKLPWKYYRYLEGKGIACAVFNPMRILLSFQINHRDHRKIVVVDGTRGFTGGLNLADEYINEVERFGHWKDCALEVGGKAAGRLQELFLRLWEPARKAMGMPLSPPASAGLKQEGKRQSEESAKGGRGMPVSRGFPDISPGWIQVYEDSPEDDEALGENVYLGIINRASSYVFITTPYLIPSAEMVAALCLAAKSGIDLRIMTPGIPDKWYVHAVSRANYLPLLRAGVRIYEYSLGFVHSKTFVSDDRAAVVGTINLDFRSLYLHFECGARLYGGPVIPALKEDFISTLESCREIRVEDIEAEPILKRAQGWVLRFFSPMM
ncbi:MAG TPA: phospholipase D-like domain-containing protein [Rectinemataceae bacterium]